MNRDVWSLLEKYVYPTSMPPPKKRTKPMQVLAVGFPRSATESLQTALLTLGYDHTFHGWDLVFDEPFPIPAWVRLFKKKYNGARDGDSNLTVEDFDGVLGHCSAVVDHPAACFAPELIAAYPDAKIILNYREDKDAWHRSVIQAMGALYDDKILACTIWFNTRLFWLLNYHLNYAWKSLFHSNTSEGIKRNGKWILRDHMNMIRGLVPPERLLEWRVEQGWEPLCEFLGKELPKEPFPRSNAGGEFDKRVADLLKDKVANALMKISLLVLTVGGLGAWAVYRRL